MRKSIVSFKFNFKILDRTIDTNEKVGNGIENMLRGL